jgi:hypothetical protein
MVKFSIEKIKKCPYAIFLFKFIVFFIIIAFFDFFIGKTLRYYYFKQRSGLEYRTTYSIEKTTAEILVFGSSKANHHYRPDIFEKELKLSFYNVGRDGNFIFYHYAVLQGILKRYSPKVIILDFTRSEFLKEQSNYDRIAALLPYYKTHPEMRKIIELKDPYEKLKLLSSIYPFNSLFLTIAVGNAEFNKKRMSDNKGYVPLMNEWDKPIAVESPNDNVKIDTTTINIYKSFIQNCQSSNINLYIVCSPYFIKFIKKDASLEIARQIAKSYNVPFLDYSCAPMFITDSRLFDDPSHLNDKGAKIFSSILADTLCKLIKDDTLISK